MDNLKKIVITGPESTGKTTLCRQLAEHFNTIYIPEYARAYIEKLNREYNYKDIEHIAARQVEIEKEFVSKANNLLFYDTYLIITKVWFQWKYNRYPSWIDKQLKKSDITMFLLLNTDLQWKKDRVRENPGENRDKLFRLYQSELEKQDIKYAIVIGTDNQRKENAIRALNEIFK